MARQQQMQVAKPASASRELVAEIRHDLELMESQFSNALPPHIPAARFVRVVMTAIQNKPQLLKCTKQSLFNACMQAAQDGLLPDGREGAIVPFGDNDDDTPKSETASWMPMVNGIRKKIRNSGVLKDVNVQLVYEGDLFDYELGDNPYIRHKPAKTGGLNRPITHAYSIATFPDGHLSREVMNIEQIEDIRRRFSRAKKGPWSVPESYGEMCKKTVLRRHAKQLPSSTDLDTVMRRDDALYDLEGVSDKKKLPAARAGSATTALDWFAAGDAPPVDEGETSKQAAKTEAKPDADAIKQEAKAAAADTTNATVKRDEKPATSPDKAPPPVLPKNDDEYRVYARATVDAANDHAALREWFKSPAQRNLRNGAGVTRDLYDIVATWVDEKCKELGEPTAQEGS